eukprot:jgi/Chlat1/8532/Chrsp82S09230
MRCRHAAGACSWERLLVYSSQDCGAKTVDWDLNQDEQFNDASGAAVTVTSPAAAAPGTTYPMRARLTNSCGVTYADSTVIVRDLGPSITSVTATPTDASGSHLVGADTRVDTDVTDDSCKDPSQVTVTIDCGDGSVATASGFCKWSSPGSKEIKATATDEAGNTDTQSIFKLLNGKADNSNSMYLAYFTGRSCNSMVCKLYDAGTSPSICRGAAQWNTKSSSKWVNGKLCGK